MPSQPQAESDNSYTGFASRLDPANLPPGILQAAQNVRLQRGIAQPRKGCQRLTDASLNSLTMVGSGVWIDSLGRDNMVLVFSNRMYLYRPEQIGYPEDTIGPYVFPANRVIAQNGICDIVQVLDKIYIFRGMEREARYGTGSTSTDSALSFTHAAVSAGGSVVVTATWRNGFSTQYAINDEVTIFNLTAPSTYLLGSFTVASVSGTTSFTFTYLNTTGAPIVAATGTIYGCVVETKPPLVWNGSSVSVVPQTSIRNNVQTQAGYTTLFGSLPPADFAFYFQNRIVCNTASQEIAFSDILSTNFDLALNVFVINRGGNDSIVGCLPWIENQFLVFMRNSIYMAFLDPRFDITAPDASEVTVITTELGCLARRTIVNAGQYVMFLSSKGIYLLTPQLDLKVIGNTMPLSEAISDFFEGLDYSIVSNSVATYYDNRFFIALPIDDLANPTARNNRILIYNNLNKNWESVDIYPVGLNADNLTVASYKFQKRLFVLTNFAGALQFGGVFLTEEREDGDVYSDAFSGVALPFSLPASLNADGLVNQIDSFVRTREFTMSSLSEKRFSRGEFQFNNVQQDSVDIHAATHDPDATQEVLGYQFSGNSDGTLRPRIAMRGSGIDFTIYFSSGRPALKGVTIHGIGANRPMVSQE